MKEKMSREPVVTAAAVAAVLGVLLSLVGLEVSNEAIQQWSGALVAVISGVVYIVAAIQARSKVTPLVDPKNEDGVPLIVDHRPVFPKTHKWEPTQPPSEPSEPKPTGGHEVVDHRPTFPKTHG